MQNKKYKVYRENVYVGKLGIANYINCFSNKKIIYSWEPLRNILFSRFFNKGEDLLYNTVSCPIVDCSDNNYVGENLLIKDYINLGLLLEYFGYAKELGIDEIIKIRQTLFDGNFAKEHCADFGYREVTADKMKFYYDGKLVTDSEQLEQQRKDFVDKQKLGRRIFVPDGESVISNYFDLLNDFGDNQYVNLGFPCMMKKDGFKPNELEGPVKKLCRF